MSFYNKLFNENEDFAPLLGMLGVNKEFFDRYRDVELIENGEKIRVFIRLGGGNREGYEETWDKIQKHELYVRDYDDDFDETYAYIEFKVPDEFKERIKTDENGETIFCAEMPKEVAAMNFYKDLPDCYIPILAETKVYDEDLNYSGTFDLLMYYDATLNGKSDSNSGLLVLDWKTNKDLLNMSLNVYKLQLSLYMNCIEKIGFKVIDRKLMWLKNDGRYEKIELEEYVDRLVKYLTEHPIKMNN